MQPFPHVVCDKLKRGIRRMRMRAWGRDAVAGVVLALGLAFGPGSFGCSAGAQEAAASAAAGQLPVIHVDNGPNSEAAQKAHYIVLVSLDGFRWDYAKRDGATHLLALGRRGVWAPEGMMPSYPSLTFPNHLTIVTGLYPEHHGIVANNFYDPARNERYAISDPKAVTDGTWYGGTPLWSLAESQGMRTACFFWPGSEAKIAGYRPTYYLHFDDKIPNEARIRQVIEWLGLPPAERPHFITLYFSDVDHAGHEFGPDAPQTKVAVRKLDAVIGVLKTKLDATRLPIDLVVVSDHGMVKTEGGWITLDTFTDLTGFETAGYLLYGKTEEETARAYDQLKHATSEFMVYRRKDSPAGLNYRENPRQGDPVVIATGPYAIRARGPAEGKPDHPPNAGAHGYDPRSMPEMKASFYAQGPDLVHGRTVRTFENVNLYPWMAHMLGLAAPKTDGKLSVLAGTLRDDGKAPENKQQ